VSNEGAEVLGVHTDGARLRVETYGGDLRADALVNCAGLHCDRVGRLAGLAPEVRIVPFRGEYFELGPHAAARVRSCRTACPPCTHGPGAMSAFRDNFCEYRIR
jgi:glycine/D-amino acid oxidase-like deaminating enzyme